ncbi:hypothetical protein [Hymenobacter glacieicola]|uniref:hypothetical protein n=1 Tax=Hymenobacter glacieicola TaxID=1562124 RepID=UPI00166BDC4A|nr:hypothetical protein [Hymenobacter glacieicola]
MNTTEKLFHWSGVALLITAILLNLFQQLEAPSVVRMMSTGITFYAVAMTRYTQRLALENKALRAPKSAPQA